MKVERPPIAVQGKLRRKRFLSADEFAYRAPADRPHPQGHPAEPEPLRQLLGSRALEQRLFEPRGVPGRRRGDPARGGRRAGAAGRDVHPARRAALPTAPRSDLPRLLRESRVARRPLARARARARQPRLREPRRRDVRDASLPRKPGVALARRGRLRLARRAPLRARERGAAHARVRRRALGIVRAARVPCRRGRPPCSAS